MILSDRDIRKAMGDGSIAVDPFDETRLQPSSVDVTLHPVLRVPVATRIDLADVPAGHTEEALIGPDGYALRPGGFVLGATVEKIGVRRGHIARVEGRSSLGRLGLAIHVTAGFVDVGFGPAQITLEIANFAPWEIILRPGVPIAQIAFETISSSPLRDYSQTGRYQHQAGATESRFGWDRDAVLAEHRAAAALHDPAA